MRNKIKYILFLSIILSTIIHSCSTSKRTTKNYTKHKIHKIDFSEIIDSIYCNYYSGKIKDSIYVIKDTNNPILNFEKYIACKPIAYIDNNELIFTIYKTSLIQKSLKYAKMVNIYDINDMNSGYLNPRNQLLSRYKNFPYHFLDYKIISSNNRKAIIKISPINLIKSNNRISWEGWFGLYYTFYLQNKQNKWFISKVEYPERNLLY